MDSERDLDGASPGRREVVVLVHGLWMSGWICWPLKIFLGKAGFEVFVFSYPSLTESLDANVARLARFVSSLPRRPSHFIGHSLGGLLVMRFLSDFAPDDARRAVALGSPFAACHSAAWLGLRGWGRALLGPCLPQWDRARPAAWKSHVELGVIAGTRRLGLGSILMRDLPLPNDGVVAVDETRVPGARDFLVLPVSHTGMLFSRRVARAVAAFLRTGSFKGQHA